jgi:putative intracellular protease/amidase
MRSFGMRNFGLRNFGIAAVLLWACLCACLSTNAGAGREPQEKVLLFIRHGWSMDIRFMVREEVEVMKALLREAGFEPLVATSSGETISWVDTELLEPDLRLADVRIDKFAGVVLPCMAKGWVHAEPEEIALVKSAAEHNLPIAAQRGAIVILGEAGLLEGREYAFDPNELGIARRFFPGAGATCVGPGVVRDGTVITSSHCPYAARHYGPEKDGTRELVRLFIAALRE